MTNRLTEELAALEHARWAGWQQHVHGKCVQNDDGSLTIPSGLARHWQKLIDTPYDDLPEHSKNADRDEVVKTLRVIDASLARAGAKGGPE